MHISLATTLVVSALIGSAVLATERGERVFPLVALVASGLEALIIWKVIQLSSKAVRVDVILPALLVVAGAVCWARASKKSLVSAATVVTLAGLLQLAIAVRAFS